MVPDDQDPFRASKTRAVVESLPVALECINSTDRRLISVSDADTPLETMKLLRYRALRARELLVSKYPSDVDRNF